jgi:hypothetical protein
MDRWEQALPKYLLAQTLLSDQDSLLIYVKDILKAISKMSFGPNPALYSRFNSSKYSSIPAD